MNTVLPYPPLLLDNLKEGFAVDIINNIAKAANFSLEYVSPADRQWGAKLDDQVRALITFEEDLSYCFCKVKDIRISDLRQFLFNIVCFLRPQGMNYSGIIGMLSRGEADLTISGMYPSVERDRVVDFTLGINFDTLTLHVLNRDELQVRGIHYVNWCSQIKKC